jgi:methyl-accepting chemotaxis protein
LFAKFLQTTLKFDEVPCITSDNSLNNTEGKPTMKLLEIYLSKFRIRTKILIVAFGFLLVVLVVIAAGGYAIWNQNHLVEDAVKISTERVSVSTLARLSIVEMDANIQTLIAADDSASIRTSAIASIRKGAVLDEALAKLKESFGEDAEVDELIKLMTKVRPKQLSVISAARNNDDLQALKLAGEISPVFDKINKLAGSIAERSKNLLQENTEKAKKKSLIVIEIAGLVCLIGVSLGFIFTLALSRMMSERLKLISNLMYSLSQGDLTVDIDASTAGQDEIGSVIKSMHETTVRLRDLMGRISNASSDVLKESNSVADSARNMESAAGILDHSINEIGQETDNLKLISDNASEHLTGASQDTDSASIAASESTQRILKSVDNFSRFRTELEATTEQSRELSNIAKHISTITQTISEISDQTNLLALNAAIEAARAGEQGRGFAVVADEVRTLAGRTSEAVDEISDLVTGITQRVNSTLGSMENVLEIAHQNIEHLEDAADQTKISSGLIQGISDVMRQIVGYVESQMRATESIATASNEVVQVSGNNRMQSEELHSRSEGLNQSAQELKTVVSHFKF